ncbi:MAG: hypothetical protein ACE5DZ_09400 [Mariprofundus sp.]
MATPALSATSLATLQADGRIKIKTWVEPQDSMIARQQLQLNIEIATDTRFAAGTRIGHVDIDDAIVLQREKFAVNSTRSEEGRNWVVQLWTLTVYPQRGGTFDVPAIALHLSIAEEQSGTAITGTLYTKPLQFQAIIPPALQGKGDKWVATSRFEVSDILNRSLDHLKPGDAIVRTIRISADNLPAMMLPAAQAESIEGISIYKKTPRLNDRSNRGDYLAERVDVLTYVFEKPGNYVLPARNYDWWNLETGNMESVELPAYQLDVGGAFNSRESLGTGDVPNTPSPLQALLMMALLLLLAGIVITFWKRRAKQAPSQHHVFSEREILKRFKLACQQHQAREAVALFYQWLDHYSGYTHAATFLQQQDALLAGFKQIMRQTYAPTSQDATSQNDINLTIFSDQLLHALKKKKQRRKSGRWRVNLSLNNH